MLFRSARANHITVDEAKNAPEVVLGILPVNSIPARVRFDTGASHSFVSQRFAHMHGLPMSSLPNNLMVKSPGAEMTTSKISHGSKIKIEGHMFLASLIILGNSDIDVILGINWLKANKAKIDCATKSVSLEHPAGQIVYSPTQKADRKSTRLNSSHITRSRMPSSA